MHLLFGGDVDLRGDEDVIDHRVDWFSGLSVVEGGGALTCANDDGDQRSAQQHEE